VLGEIANKRLVVVTGKGGVGKTTLSAALALSSARAGKRTLVCEVNATERVTRLLGVPPAGPEVTQVADQLWAVDVRPHEAMREYALMILKFESVYQAVFENKVTRYFLRFIPSLQELVMLGKILFHLREKRPDGTWRFEQIVIDAPATGHAVTFFSVPQVLLDTLPAGSMATEARWMRDLLVDPTTTAAVLVSLPEELPVNETLELFTLLTHKVGLHVGGVVLNCRVLPRFSPEEVAAIPELLRPTAHRHLLASERSRTALERLSSLGVPVSALPRLFVDDFGRGAIDALVAQLEGRGAAP
jgi:anion-transporting  ArsA/GET3 family ATPase